MFSGSPKISLDATYSIGRNLSGVGVYSRELLRGLPDKHPGKYQFCYRPHRFLRSFREDLPPGVGRRLLWGGLEGRADLFHGLNQRVEKGRYRRVVTTFHDLFVMTSEYSTAEFRARFTAQAREAAARSDLIIAVSEFTARQVESLLAVERSRIRVVRHGVRAPSAGTSPRVETKRVLFVGAIQKRKNVVRLVKAFEALPVGWKLTLVGSLGYGAAEVIAAVQGSTRCGDIELPGYVSAARLEQLYREAAVFAFPSLDEGFGMPILEAMARGVPVLTSNHGAMAEVSGDGALLVQAESVESIAEGLCKISLDDGLRQALREKGRIQAGHFSWEKAVDQSWAAYQELLGRPEAG